jgi:hypothetical protein
MQQAVKMTVEAAVDRMLTDGNRQDTALIFFAGHGLKPESGKLYLQWPTPNLSRAVSAGR